MFKKILTLGLLLIFAVGCQGYTTQMTPPKNIKTIYVPTAKNHIQLEMMDIYTQGMEVDLTNAIIDRLNFDGTLKVVNRPEDADATLYVTITNFQQEGARFTNLESVREYRLYIYADVALKDNRTDEVLLSETGFHGRTAYFPRDSRLASRSTTQKTDANLQEPLKVATQRVVKDFARNVVDLITENW